MKKKLIEHSNRIYHQFRYQVTAYLINNGSVYSRRIKKHFTRHEKLGCRPINDKKPRSAKGGDDFFFLLSTLLKRSRINIEITGDRSVRRDFSWGHI